MRVLVARARAGDVAYVVAVVDRIAEILAAQGDTDPADVRRAKALRVLANPARALALLTGAELADLASDDDQALDPFLDNSEEPVGWMRDAQGRPLDGMPERGALVDGPGDDAGPFELDELFGAVVVGASDPGPGSARCATHPESLGRLLAALGRLDATAFDPVTVFHVHLAAESVETGYGTARVEGLGPATLGAVRAWLGDPVAAHRVSLRPVLDGAAVVPVDRYEIPASMRELVASRIPFEAFPFGTLDARKADGDHVTAYQASGPPGQTCLENLTPLGRKHHRLKTHGGWILRQPTPGVHWWRTPHGHWFRIDHTGTHHHGRDPDLDAKLI